MSQADSNGNMNYSKDLEKLVRGFELTDVWVTISPSDKYTHYTPHGATRLDRMYVFPKLRSSKTGVVTVLATFTNHLAVCLHITLDAPRVQRRRG